MQNLGNDLCTSNTLLLSNQANHGQVRCCQCFHYRRSPLSPRLWAGLSSADWQNSFQIHYESAQYPRPQFCHTKLQVYNTSLPIEYHACFQPDAYFITEPIQSSVLKKQGMICMQPIILAPPENFKNQQMRLNS